MVKKTGQKPAASVPPDHSSQTGKTSKSGRVTTDVGHKGQLARVVSKTTLLRTNAAAMGAQAKASPIKRPTNMTNLEKQPRGASPTRTASKTNTLIQSKFLI